MSYTGNPVTSAAFLTDQFSGTGVLTSFTMSTFPANTASMLVAISGVLQNPSTYGIVGNVLTFTSAPAVGTGNISIRYLGVVASGVVSTAYRTTTEFTATLGQTVFTPPSYTVGFVDVYQNGARLGAADYTASNGTTVVLLISAGLNDLISIVSFFVSSVVNAIPSTVGAVTTNLLSNGGVTLAKIDQTGSSGQVMTANGSGSTPAWNALNNTGMRNRVINGAMQIDQWRAGAQSTNIAGYAYALDRFNPYGSIAGKFTSQQNAGSVTPPPGFSNYLGITSTTAYAVLTSDSFDVQQSIEANNITDFAWGTASAQPVTLSFYVYSSLTGTFGGAIHNYTGSRTYPFSYSVPVANTWTKITITVPGDTGGSWVLSGTGGSVIVKFSLGAGSTVSGTAGSWSSNYYISTTGAVSVVGTSGATFYLTGVQLEVGSVANPLFERRPYGLELALCQRYYVNDPQQLFNSFYAPSATGVTIVSRKFPVTMRTNPTILLANTAYQNWNLVSPIVGLNDFGMSGNAPAAGVGFIAYSYSASAEL